MNQQNVQSQFPKAQKECPKFMGVLGKKSVKTQWLIGYKNAGPQAYKVYHTKSMTKVLQHHKYYLYLWIIYAWFVTIINVSCLQSIPDIIISENFILKVWKKKVKKMKIRQMN